MITRTLFEHELPGPVKIDDMMCTSYKLMQTGDQFHFRLVGTSKDGYMFVDAPFRALLKKDEE